MSKTVVRTWTTKTGIVKTKTYTYKSSSYKTSAKQSSTAIKRSTATTYVFKSGKLSKAYYREYNRIKNEEGVLEAQAFKEEIDYLRTRTTRERRITNLTLSARRASTRIEIFLDNFGYDPEDFAIEVGTLIGYNVDESYVVLESSWENWIAISKKQGSAIFVAPEGENIDVEWDYLNGIELSLA